MRISIMRYRELRHESWRVLSGGVRIGFALDLDKVRWFDADGTLFGLLGRVVLLVYIVD
jgi:hypothetical protein